MKAELVNVKLIKKIADVKGVVLTDAQAKDIYVKLANAQLDAILEPKQGESK